MGTEKKENGRQVIPCDMTGDSSGGPWLADFNETTGEGTLVSVHSSLDGFTPTKMYGEILGATARTMYGRAERGWSQGLLRRAAPADRGSPTLIPPGEVRCRMPCHDSRGVDQHCRTRHFPFPWR